MSISRWSAGLIGAFALSLTAAQAADKTVLVALVSSSAKSSFDDIVAAYQKAHPDVSVQASYVGSKTIMAQVEQGSGDVVVVNTSAIGSSTGLDSPTIVYKNHTAIIVAKSAAAKIHDAKDLAKPGVRIAGATPNSVAAAFQGDAVAKLSGAYGKDFGAKYDANVVVKKTDNEKIAASVADGQADAAILFASDAEASGLTVVPLPAEAQSVLPASVASVKASTHAAAAKAFAAYIAGPEAAAMFKAHHHDPK